MEIDFECDDAKAAQNARKHGVSFEEATSVFLDATAGTYPDPDHSADEQRELIIGSSSAHRLIMVSYTHRGPAVRIISARTATRHERLDHERGRR